MVGKIMKSKVAETNRPTFGPVAVGIANYVVRPVVAASARRLIKRLRRHRPNSRRFHHELRHAAKGRRRNNCRM